MRVMIAGDDSRACRIISLMFRNNYAAVVDTEYLGEEVIERARQNDYDAILLDITLPDVSGLDLLRRLRATIRSTPVLVLTGRSRPQARIAAFDAGADDVMTKPIKRAELVARIKAVVRRSKGHSQPGLQFGPVLLDLDAERVSVNEIILPLTRKEYAVLELLVLRRDTVLTKKAILNHLYGSTKGPELQIIDAFIYKLRKKFAAAGVPSLIDTVYGCGYIMRTPQDLLNRSNFPTNCSSLLEDVPLLRDFIVPIGLSIPR